MKKDEQKHLRDLERLRRLRPIDDDFMRCLFRDNRELVQEMLRIITVLADLEILEFEAQKDLKRLGGARSVCLDVWAKDSSGRIYNLEIQRADKKDEEERIRYHASVLNISHLDAGDKFGQLPQMWIILILEKDPFALGLPVYHIERTIRETGEAFDDGEHILCVNGEYRGDSEISRLMHDFSCSSADEMLLDLMAKRTRYLKENKEGATAMCKILEEMRKEAREEKELENLSSVMKKLNLTIEQAMDALSIPEENQQKYRMIFSQQTSFQQQ